jgi:acetamidase/formamidase
MATTPAVHIARDRYHLAWDPAIPAIEAVDSGSIVEFDLLDASGGQLSATSTVEELGQLDFDRVDQVNGPIAVVGAEPGDTLQIDLLEFEPAGWGWTANIPGFGLLADQFTDPYIRITKVPRPGERAEFLPGARVPIVPFCGEIGVAPVDGPRSTIPPDLHGGNMDTRHLTAGATLFLPVFHAGARFSIGDGHAAQGDGEVCMTAIECPMDRVDLTFHLNEHMRLTAPRAHTSVGWLTLGLHEDLNEATFLAVEGMLDLMVEQYRLARVDALALASLVVDLRITQIANGVLGVHAVLPHGAIR